jgi:hypothetical protein
VKTRGEDTEFCAHLGRLRLTDTAAYLRWCEEHGLRASTRKSAREREREFQVYQEMRWKGALDTARQLKRRPEAVLEAALNGTLNTSHATRQELIAVQALARPLRESPRKRAAALELLTLAQRRRFLLADRVIGKYDPFFENTLIGGLFVLVRLLPYWIRPLETWQPDSHNPQRQFASLARHLLAEWEVPACLDGAFFRPPVSHPPASKALEWWRHVARGQSLYSAPHLPLTLTRKMAHLIHTTAPDSLTPEEALRWGQGCGLGMGERQVRALLATPLGMSFRDESFWGTFVRFVSENPLLDPAQIGPLHDYLHWERTEPHRQGERDRLPTGFTLKGRTAGVLLERMEAWHARTVQIERLRVTKWDPTGREGLVLAEGAWRWQLQELTTAKELSQEGRAMRHCVATYAPSCARGNISIWSLQAQGPPTDGWLRVMTIAVSRQGQITEARGWCNALPTADGKGGYVRLASDEQAILLRSRRMVQRWAAQEGLTLPYYLTA